MRKACLVFLLLSLFFPLVYKHTTQGFRLGKLYRPAKHLQSQGEKIDPLVRKYLSQPFSYLGKGMQCFVFEGEDKEVVLKLFRVRSRKNKNSLSRLIKASKLAFSLAKEETGLLYVHTEATSYALPSVLLNKRWGLSYSIPLDDYSFVLQKKVKSLEEAFLEASKDGSLGALLDSYLALIQKRAAKGICNTDAHVTQNFGFLSGKAIEIDFGNYLYAPEKKDEEVNRFTKRMRKFLQKQAPNYVAEYDQKTLYGK